MKRPDAGETTKLVYDFLYAEGIFVDGDKPLTHKLAVSYLEAAYRLHLTAAEKFIPVIYKNGSDITYHLTHPHSYSSMSEFNASTLSDVTFNLESSGTNVWGCDPVAFNFNERKTASFRYGKNFGITPSYNAISIDGLEKSGFDKFGYTKTASEEFLEEHLKHCGLSGEGLEKLKAQIITACTGSTFGY